MVPKTSFRDELGLVPTARFARSAWRLRKKKEPMVPKTSFRDELGREVASRGSRRVTRDS